MPPMWSVCCLTYSQFILNTLAYRIKSQYTVCQRNNSEHLQRDHDPLTVRNAHNCLLSIEQHLTAITLLITENKCTAGRSRAVRQKVGEGRADVVDEDRCIYVVSESVYMIFNVYWKNVIKKVETQTILNSERAYRKKKRRFLMM